MTPPAVPLFLAFRLLSVEAVGYFEELHLHWEEALEVQHVLVVVVVLLLVVVVVLLLGGSVEHGVVVVVAVAAAPSAVVVVAAGVAGCESFAPRPIYVAAWYHVVQGLPSRIYFLPRLGPSDDGEY
jgi:hypothetical protein